MTKKTTHQERLHEQDEYRVKTKRLLALKLINPITYKFNADAFTLVNVLFDKARRYKRLCSSIRECHKCAGLNLHGITESAPGWGNLNADIFFVGQSLCTDCMATQMPFTKGSGYYLDAVLTASNLLRKDVFITNVVHCHPLNNRVSTPSELDNCCAYLREELDIVQPKLIVAMGNSAKIVMSRLDLDIKGEVVKCKHPASFLYSNSKGVIDWIVSLSMRIDQCLKTIY